MECAASERGVDLEGWEFGLRQAVLLAGARLLEQMLRGVGSGRRSEPLPCCCGAMMQSEGLREKRIKTVLGDITLKRSMFVCPSCGDSRFPADEMLNVSGTGFSPGVRRMMARAGSNSTFKEAKEDLKVYAEMEVSAKDVERVAEGTGEAVEAWQSRQQSTILEEAETEATASIPLLYVSYDGTGVPMVPWETEGRKGKQPDGSSKTREVKLGCVFTQTGLDEEGHPVRDGDSTSFVGAIESAEEFGWRIYGEALRRGLDSAKRVVVLGDGAEWIKNLAEMHFPKATHIIDLYHARQHVSNLCKILFAGDEKRLLRHRKKWWTYLDWGMVERLIRDAQRKLPKNHNSKKEALREISYLKKNKERMRYAEFRRQGLFVGSGVVEAGCKSIIGKRLKQSGMQWTVRGANSIIALRTCYLSARWEDFWEQRAA